MPYVLTYRTLQPHLTVLATRRAVNKLCIQFHGSLISRVATAQMQILAGGRCVEVAQIWKFPRARPAAGVAIRYQKDTILFDTHIYPDSVMYASPLPSAIFSTHAPMLQLPEITTDENDMVLTPERSDGRGWHQEKLLLHCGCPISHFINYTRVVQMSEQRVYGRFTCCTVWVVILTEIHKIPTEHKPIPGGHSHKMLTDWDWLALEQAGPLDTTLWDLTTNWVAGVREKFSLPRCKSPESTSRPESCRMTVPLHGKCDFTCKKCTGEFMQSMRAPSEITYMQACKFQTRLGPVCAKRRVMPPPGA
ncbi:hypothetical protein B0H13DRAFT_1861056 [Mycena leptocephala]|nr:hypothetical protein B0H13DRAFT_1861056 [Mycena leptocephala]